MHRLSDLQRKDNPVRASKRGIPRSLMLCMLRSTSIELLRWQAEWNGMFGSDSAIALSLTRYVIAILGRSISDVDLKSFHLGGG